MQLINKKINETQTKLKDIEEAVKKYSSKTIVKKDIEPINNIIIKAKEIDVNNLTEGEKIKIDSYINALEKILGSYV